MKAILKVKQVVEYERLYEVECLDDIENEEDLKDLIYDINTNLTLDVSDGADTVELCVKSEKDLFESVFDSFGKVNEEYGTKTNKVSSYMTIPDDMTLEKFKIEEKTIKCEI